MGKASWWLTWDLWEVSNRQAWPRWEICSWKTCPCTQSHPFKESRSLSACYMLGTGLGYWLPVMDDTEPLTSWLLYTSQWQMTKGKTYDMKSAFNMCVRVPQKKAAMVAMALFWTGWLGAAPWRCHCEDNLVKGMKAIQVFSRWQLHTDNCPPPPDIRTLLACCLSGTLPCGKSLSVNLSSHQLGQW